jgi:hypothetical protein
VCYLFRGGMLERWFCGGEVRLVLLWRVGVFVEQDTV